jgi:steroid delta-isomerase-like uncharacterized protein
VTDTTRGRRLETAHRFAEEVLHAGDAEVAEELLTPTYRLHETGRTSIDGREGVLERVRALRRAFPDLRHYVLDRLVDGAYVVERWVLEGVHRGEFMGLAPTGRRVRVEGVAVMRFEGARIAEVWQYWDRLGLLEQLGAADALPAGPGPRAEPPPAPPPAPGEEPGGRSW